MQVKKRDVKAREKEVVKNKKGQKINFSQMNMQDNENSHGNRKKNPHYGTTSN